MFTFKIKRTEYEIEVDEWNYILKKKGKENKQGEMQYIVLGYYGDLFYLLLKMMKLGAIENKKGKDIESFIRETLNTLKTSLESSIEGPRRRDLGEG